MGFRVEGSGFRVKFKGSGFRVYCSGFRIEGGAGLRKEGLRFDRFAVQQDPPCQRARFFLVQGRETKRESSSPPPSLRHRTRRNPPHVSTVLPTVWFIGCPLPGYPRNPFAER